MGGASKVMYSIANFFTWLIVIGCAAGLVFLPLIIVGIMPNNTGYQGTDLIGYSVYLGIALFFALLSIMLVRIAKASGTSKGWDVLFIIVGVLSGNIFYVLGGIFGLFE